MEADVEEEAARTEDARGTPTHSHILPSILVYEEEENIDLVEADVEEEAADHGDREGRQERVVLPTVQSPAPAGD